MEPRIETITEKKLAGKRIRMSLSGNKTFELWQGFMRQRKEIKNNVGSDLFSVQVYDKSLDFSSFTSGTEFEKWAAVEVTDFDCVPDGMETYILEGGLYAVFVHRGAADTAQRVFGYIFGVWLPQSGYVLDDRAHFEVMGDKYKNGDPDSEEEVWIPIRAKG